ncbi:LEA type 2 family protein [Halegenticoccus tardaugens]|uniref:LEA type 2 family protein n=1 Tax=Halegenticoccus tardaugens TaxID=2071624 RepID=UPI00100A3047|nr:LEA type 2 family protein [Halegenticoccus tardaugens]
MKTRTRRLLVGIAAITLVIAGSGLWMASAGAIPQPSAGVETAGEWGNVTEQRTEVVTTFWVDNPYPVRITTGDLLDLDYRLELNGVTVAEGSWDEVDLPRGNTTQTQSTYLRNDRLAAWWVRFVEDDETLRATAHGRAVIDGPFGDWTYERSSATGTHFANRTPVSDAISGAAAQTEGEYVRTRSVRYGGVERDVTVGAEVRDARATWGRVDRNGTTVLFRFRIHNPSDAVPLVVEPTGLRLRADANGVRLFRSGSGVLSREAATDDRLVLPGETRDVTIAATVDNRVIDDWFRSHVRNGERSTIETRLQLVVDPVGAGEPIRVPEDDEATHRCTVRTAVLEDGQRPGTTCGAQSGSPPVAT